MTYATCIYSETSYNDPALQCGKRVFGGTHGFLCRAHYLMDQVVSKKLKNPNPIEIEASIIAHDAELIRAARAEGRVHKIQYKLCVEYPPVIH